MFRQDHQAVPRESSHLQCSTANNTQTRGALSQCPAALSQPCAVSGNPRYHFGSVTCGCPEVTSVEQRERQRLHRHDSCITIDGLHQGSLTFFSSCPMLPPVHSANVKKVSTVQAVEDPSAFSHAQGQAASSYVPGSTRHIAASDSTASQTVVVSAEDVMDTVTGTVKDFSSGPLPETSTLSAKDTVSATVRGPLESSSDPGETSTGLFPYVTNLRSEGPIPGDRQTSFKSAGVSTRVPHKLVERRYRDKVKAQLDVLYSRLPTLKSNYPCTSEVEESPRSLKGPPKAVVIAGAVKYIERLESELKESRLFVKRLQEQVTGLQRLVKCDDCSLLRYFESANTQSAARVSDS